MRYLNASGAFKSKNAPLPCARMQPQPYRRLRRGADGSNAANGSGHLYTVVVVVGRISSADAVGPTTTTRWEREEAQLGY